MIYKPIEGKITFFFIVEPLVLNLECPRLLFEGYNATLHCNATGNPPPNINWIRKDTGVVLGTNEQLALTDVRRSEAGTYQCSAWNGIGNNSTRTCSLDVYCKPSLLSIAKIVNFPQKNRSQGCYFQEFILQHRRNDIQIKPRLVECFIHTSNR